MFIATPLSKDHKIPHPEFPLEGFQILKKNKESAIVIAPKYVKKHHAYESERGSRSPRKHKDTSRGKGKFIIVKRHHHKKEEEEKEKKKEEEEEEKKE